MSLTQILLKNGIGSPGTSLLLSEPAYDASNNIFYIGMGLGQDPIPFYPYQSVIWDYINGGNDWITPLYDYVVGGYDWVTPITDRIVGGTW